jgi:RNA polymerase sigma-70 factor, ECF subfamily
VRELGEQEVRLEQTAEAAFDMLIRQYVNKVLRLVYLIVKDRNLAEDITQDVFMKAYQNIGSFRKESSIQTWVYKIAVNEAKKHLRSWSFRHLFFRPAVDLEVVEGTESAVLQHDIRMRVARLVMELPPRYREMIVLHYYEDLSVEEMAEILGTSAGAVYTNLHRARKKLKERLEKEGMEWT